VRRVWERQMAYVRKQIACVTVIQRIFRGKLDREIAFHRREKMVSTNVYAYEAQRHILIILKLDQIIINKFK
jgi:hypothetical protein